MDDVNLDDLYADLVLAGNNEHPAVTLHLVTSLNGAAAGPDGRSGTLGGKADTIAMGRVRDAADVILVGGSTVRAEGYGPVRTSPERQQVRASKGLSSVPRLAVFTNSGVDTERLRGSGERPILLTGNADLDGDPNADTLILDAPIQPARLVSALHAVGLSRVLCEGGPSLARWLLEGEVVDELFLTVAPAIVGGGQPQLLPDPLPHLDLELVSAYRHGNDLLTHYRVQQP